MLKPSLTLTRSGKQGKLKAALSALASIERGPDSVKVGFPARKTDSDIVQRAVWQEFGTRGGASGGGWGGPTPERPFMRNAMRANRGKYQKAMAAALREILNGALDGRDVAGSKRQALSRLGILAQGDIQEEITSLSSPPNAPLTIKLKGSSNPLIDTGEMRARVTYLIEE